MNIKLLISGDAECGKTSLHFVFTEGTNPWTDELYMPTSCDTLSTQVHIGKESISVFICENSGLGKYDRIRPLSYTGQDIIILIFSIDNRDSFKNVMAKWAPEAKKFCPNVPVLLVGNKIDLRNEENAIAVDLIGPEEGQAMADEIGAFAYLECSTKSQEGVKEVLEAATVTALEKVMRRESKRSKSTKCILF